MPRVNSKVMWLKDKWIALVGVKNERNRMLRNNILFSAVLKAIGLLTSLLIVPITVDYLDNEVYGVWMTISSILYWISTFDIGLGNGMRNYLTEALSRKDYALGRKYVTTTLVYLSVIALAIFLVILIPMLTMNYNKVLNTDHISNLALRDAFFIAVVFTLFNFVLKNIGYIFVALQKYALNDLLTVAGNVLALIAVFILTKVTTGNLIYVVLAFTAVPVLVYLIASVPVFRKYPELKPTRKSFDSEIGKVVVKKGLGFFFIQITSVLVIYGAANIFITQYCGPTQVTVYSIAYKYFNLLIIGFTVLISPMWNAYTDAYVKGDYGWISLTFKRSLRLWLLTLVAGVMMLALSNMFFALWLGGKVVVPFTVSLCTLVYVCCFNLNSCATALINGLNKIYVQIITSVVFTALYIILTFLVGSAHNIEGIVLCMAASYLLMAVIHLYQCRLLISRKANGIWNK